MINRACEQCGVGFEARERWQKLCPRCSDAMNGDPAAGAKLAAVAALKSARGALVAAEGARLAAIGRLSKARAEVRALGLNPEDFL